MAAVLKSTAVVSHVHIMEATYDLPSVRENTEKDAKTE